MRRLSGIVAVCSMAVLAMTGCGGRGTPLSDTWKSVVDSAGAGIAGGWFGTGYDRSAWRECSVPEKWEDAGLGSYDGAVWYATTRAWGETVPVTIVFKGVDDAADVWVNGVYIGFHTGYSDPFSIDIPDSLRADSMLVVVRVTDLGGPGGITGNILLAATDEAEVLMRTPIADKEARHSADWVRSALVYEVYLRSFSPEGTFEGLRQRLPELKKLGVTVIWLMPIHPVGELNRKGRLGSPYSVADYESVNPEFGTMDDFRRLVAAVHESGMKIIIDLVVNHTAWDNHLLIKHPDWYTHDDEGAIVAPNSDWSDVADLNYDRHELRKYMIDMMKFWVEDVDIDGFRADVAELVPTDFWVHARYELDKIKPIMLLAEGSLPEHHLEAFDVSYAWTTYDVLDPLLNGKLSSREIVKILRNESRRFPIGSLQLRFNTNHDKNAYDGPAIVRWGKDGLLLSSTLMYVLPGIPLVYNGEEAGNSKKLTLFDKVSIDWEGGQDLRGHFEKLGSLRRLYPWLSTAPWRQVSVPNGSTALLLMRTGPDDEGSILASLNFTQSEVKIDIPIPREFKDRILKDVFTAAQIPPADRLLMSLPPRGFSIIMAQ